MPLIKSGSKKAFSKNVGELISTKPGKVRAKGIKTLAKERYIPSKRAKAIQAAAIAYAIKRKAEKKAAKNKK